MTKAKDKPKPRAKPTLPKVRLADDDDVQPSEAVEESLTGWDAQDKEPPMFGKKDETDKFKRFRKFELAEMRPYEEGEDMTGIRVGDEDQRSFNCPKKGDMICRNVTNHTDQWLLSAEAFRHHFEPFDK